MRIHLVLSSRHILGSNRSRNRFHLIKCLLYPTGSRFSFQNVLFNLINYLALVYFINVLFKLYLVLKLVIVSDHR